MVAAEEGEEGGKVGVLLVPLQGATDVSLAAAAGGAPSPGDSSPASQEFQRAV